VTKKNKKPQPLYDFRIEALMVNHGLWLRLGYTSRRKKGVRCGFNRA